MNDKLEKTYTRETGRGGAQEAILKYFEPIEGVWMMKKHQSAYSIKGHSDLYGVVLPCWLSTTWCRKQQCPCVTVDVYSPGIPFYIEVKAAKKSPEADDPQVRFIRKARRFRAMAGFARSIADCLRILDTGKGLWEELI